MKKHLVLLMGTGKYAPYMKEAIDSLKNWFPGEDKLVAIISDNPDMLAYPLKTPELNLQFVSERIEHYQLPFIWFMKVHYMKKYCELYHDLICDAMYMDVSCRVRKPFRIPLSKVTFITHYLYPRFDGVDRRGLHNQNVASKSYLTNEERKIYVNGGIYFGGTDKMITFCDELLRAQKEEFDNFTIPTWHDESCINYIVNRDCISHEREGKEFTYLVLKDELFDEGAPKRYLPKTIEDFYFSFVNYHEIYADRGYAKENY